MEEGFRGLGVGGQGHPVDVAHPHESLDVGLVGLGREGILEEDHPQDLALGHPGPDLHIPPKGP